MKSLLITLTFLLGLTSTTFAQQPANVPDTPKLEAGRLGIQKASDSSRKKRSSISIGTGGFHYDNGKPDTVFHRFEVQYGMLDLGFNSLIDNTAYPADPLAKPFTPLNAYLAVGPEYKNKDLFSLRQGKSINVNIYPLLVKAHLYRSKRQSITLASGIGLQLYNFRFTKPVTYVASPTTHVILDTVSFSKNKLAFNYLTVPLMLNGKTKLVDYGNKFSKNGSGLWLVYGGGISVGYLLSSWTKQISDERGKDKNHDPFNFRKTNLCVNGEIGLDGYIRLYASYQLTSLHEDVLDQHPFSIGVRFLGF